MVISPILVRMMLCISHNTWEKGVGVGEEKGRRVLNIEKGLLMQLSKKKFDQHMP